MQLFVFSQLMLLATTFSSEGVWRPSQGLLYSVLVCGSLLAAGVALSAFTFYEDYYWSDEKYREQLRFDQTRREDLPKQNLRQP